MDHEEARREKQSLDLIKNLRHPFLLQTHSYHQKEDRLFIVMELADGSLRDRLKECHKAGQGGVPPQELVRSITEAAEALDFLHENHIMHRDIKPENILLLKRHAKVADFGLARMQEGSRMGTEKNSGTPLYMAPEIWKGKVSQHSDQYSLALTYAEMRLARRVFTGTQMMEVMIDHLERQPEFPDLPPAEATVLIRALAKDPAQRFPSCLAFAEALRASFSGEVSRGGGMTGLTGTGNFSFSTPTATGSVPQTLTPSSAVGPMYASGPGSAPSGVGAPPRPSMGVLVGAAVGTVMCVAAVAALIAFLWPRPEPTGRPQTGKAKDQTLAEAVPLPDGYKPAPGDEIVPGEGGKSYHSRIVTTRGDQEVVFRLVPRKRPDEPPTFYMMENKVWNALFKVATRDPAYKEALDKWRSAYPWTIKGDWKLDGGDRLPVVNVTPTEAFEFARWLKGHLPLVMQWDKAAGYYDPDRGRGPFKQGWKPGEIAINRDGPLPVGEAAADVSPYGIRDMAGNGLEYTRNISGEPVLRVPLSTPTKDKHQVLLRGASFEDKLPLEYATLDPESVRGVPLSQKYEEGSKDVSFRVVLEP
jgi:formylglycine-generating enzyme required for sulfatase activity